MFIFKSSVPVTLWRPEEATHYPDLLVTNRTTQYSEKTRLEKNRSEKTRSEKTRSEKTRSEKTRSEKTRSEKTR